MLSCTPFMLCIHRGSHSLENTQLSKQNHIKGDNLVFFQLYLWANRHNCMLVFVNIKSESMKENTVWSANNQFLLQIFPRAGRHHVNLRYVALTAPRPCRTMEIQKRSDWKKGPAGTQHFWQNTSPKVITCTQADVHLVVSVDREGWNWCLYQYHYGEKLHSLLSVAKQEKGMGGSGFFSNDQYYTNILCFPFLDGF